MPRGSMKTGIVAWDRKGVNRDLVVPVWIGLSVMTLNDLYETDCYHIPSPGLVPLRGLRPIR